MKEHEKLCLKMVSEIVCIFVCGHLSLWKDVEDKGSDGQGLDVYDPWFNVPKKMRRRVVVFIP